MDGVRRLRLPSVSADRVGQLRRQNCNGRAALAGLCWLNRVGRNRCRRGRRGETWESALDTATPQFDDRPRPEAGARGLPTSTYRLQLTREFTFDDATAIVGYLHRLGVSHVYLSPILQAAPGSTHGYDVIDHDRISADLGGEAGLRRLADALHAHGMGAIADVVPNHMGMPVPECGNRALWSVLRDGPASPYASWFDIDWDAQEGTVLLPVLGRRIGECLREGEITLDTEPAGAPGSDRPGEPVLRYYDHVFPVRPGTEALRLPELVQAQHYRLAHWRVAIEEPGYRRFFDVSTLIALRVEDPAVFDATHRLLLGLVADGTLDGLRVDHPDGLADPAGYLRRLAAASGGCWTLVEKILARGEELPEQWACAGTTGYDAEAAVTALLVDPAGAARLASLHSGLTGAPEDFAVVATQAKLDVLETVLHAELDRLTDLLAAICRADLYLRDHTHAALREAVRALLAACPVYRVYVTPGEPADPEASGVLDQAATRAKHALPEERHAAVALVRDLALGRIGPRDALRDEFQIRFQQTCGPVMAKGVEDTAFYRWTALPFAAEVGGDPNEPALSPAGFHRFCAQRHARHPAAMTVLSTHDTKRSEDVRARLAVFSELVDDWAGAVAGWQAEARRPGLLNPAGRAPGPDRLPDPTAEYLLWQTLVACWPISKDRLEQYLTKAMREAKLSTSWTAPDSEYEAAVQHFASAVLADPTLCAGIAAFAVRIRPYAEVNMLTQKLVQLTMTGVPDLYQGTETEFVALVDPDNRRPVDFAALEALLASVDARDGSAGADAGSAGSGDQGPDPAAGRTPIGAAKLKIAAVVLRLRREHPEWFGPESPQTPLFCAGPAADHAVAFLRGDRVAVVGTRLPAGLERAGGWRETALALPPGDWRCRLSGRIHCAGPDAPGAGAGVPLAGLTADHPVALLVREGER
jgi:(1->4)-alpha-D-glucan 1-alpha-D-glucosylmutase